MPAAEALDTRIEEGKRGKIGLAGGAYGGNPGNRARRDGIQEEAIKFAVGKVGRTDVHAIEYIFGNVLNSIHHRGTQGCTGKDGEILISGRTLPSPQSPCCCELSPCPPYSARSRRHRSPSRECRAPAPRGRRVRRASSILRSSARARRADLRDRDRRRRCSTADRAQTGAGRS